MSSSKIILYIFIEGLSNYVLVNAYMGRVYNVLIFLIKSIDALYHINDKC